MIFIGLMYNNFQKHNQHDLEHELKESINIHKTLLLSALEDTYTTLEQRKSFFKHIHRTALDILKKNENISLEHLRDEIISHFNLKDIDIDLFLIDQNYVIVDGTFKKDIGLDFKKIPDGKRDLDKASKDDDIHIGDNIAIDYMDSSIKTYSCARINHDKYLEMAFIDPFIYNKLRKRIAYISKNTKHRINIFRIKETSSNEEYYEDIMNTKTIINKKKWNDSLKKFPLDTATDNKIINAKRQNNILRDDKDTHQNTVPVYVPLLSKDYSYLAYNDFVLKLEIDLSEHNILWQETKNIFILLNLVILPLMILLYYIIKHSFYIPVTTISKSFDNEVKIDEPGLLRKKDEFGTLVKKYNALYEKLQDQIEHNQLLLDENKQFIADMVHQIRTPLSVIMTNSSLIEMKSDLQVSPYITQINSAINMLSNSYEDLSYIISNDTLEYNPINIHFTKFLKERIEFFHVIAQANNKTIFKDIENDIMVIMNDTELERLIDNNLSNAIKHSNDKSEIKVILEKNNAEIILKFISQGQKIYDASKIFHKGYTETYGAKRSLGLGLNMVRIICEKNNIIYSANSEEGINTFTYIFKV